MLRQLDFYFISCIKINSKQINDLNIRAKRIKHLEEKIHDCGLGNGFLDMTPEVSYDMI